MAQMGHADPKFTRKVYAHVMRRGEEERNAWRLSSAAVIGHKWAQMVLTRPTS